MRYIFTTLILVLCFGLQSVHAETVTGSPNEIFRPLSKHIVEKIVKNGTTEVGDLNLVDLLDMLETVEWRTFDLGFLAGSGGKRQTSMYFVQDRMVVVNILALQNLVDKPISLYNWALHEALGALGYPDEFYDLTTALVFMAEPNNHSVDRTKYVESIFSDIKVTTTNHVYGREGGVTIIGGGGDAPLIDFKSKMIERFITWLETHHPRLGTRKKKKAIERLIKIQVEFNKESSRESNSFSVKDGVLWIDQAGNRDPSLILTDEYLDSVLDALAPTLLK